MTRSVNQLICLVACIVIGLGMAGCAKRVIPPESAVYPAATGEPGAAAGEPGGTTAGGFGEGALYEEGGDLLTGGAGRGPMTRERFVNEDIFFEFDSSGLTPDAQEILKEKADWLKRNPEATVAIEGHCDSRGTNEYNIALGERRAEGVKNFMMSLGINGGRMRTISYGEERPVVAGETEDAWSRNRRAHFDFD
ncbi:MAG: peptidoglycan-associated lipoprotein Pal [Desulfobacterales bacterium]